MPVPSGVAPTGKKTRELHIMRPVPTVIEVARESGWDSGRMEETHGLTTTKPLAPWNSKARPRSYDIPRSSFQSNIQFGITPFRSCVTSAGGSNQFRKWAPTDNLYQRSSLHSTPKTEIRRISKRRRIERNVNVRVYAELRQEAKYVYVCVEQPQTLHGARPICS